MRAWGIRFVVALVLVAFAGMAPAAVTWPTVLNGDTGFLGTGSASLPIYITHAGDGSKRMFMIEQRGRILIIRNGAVVATPFLDINPRVIDLFNPGDEWGLLGLAFPPNYKDKRYFYVYYWPTETNETRVSRFRVTANDDTADPNSEEILLRIPQPQSNHNGGQIMFGPDGCLYVCSGDGGAAYDENPVGGSGHELIGNAQVLTNFLGKILRIDTESPPVTNSYQIPPTNPFVGNTNAWPEVWAYGLRNPYRCSFDRETGDLLIADVGQRTDEEIDFQPASSLGGENYGWRRYEGTGCTARANDPPCNSDTNSLVFPAAWYKHTAGVGGRITIIGGYVHRGSPEWWPLHGTYLFADYGSGEFWGMKKDGNLWVTTVLLNAALGLGESGGGITGSGEDEDGNVYFTIANGAVRRVVEAASDFVDTDGDQMPNLFETYYGLNPTNAADASLDPDGDGMSNREELTAGTSPTNGLSRLEVREMNANGSTNAVVLHWPSVAGRRYGVLSGTNLATAFTPVATNLPATPPLNVHTAFPGEPVRFYTLDVRTNSP